MVSLNMPFRLKVFVGFQVGAVHAVGCGRSRKVMVGPDWVPASANSLVYDDRDPHPCDDARTAALRSTAAGHSAP